MAEKIAIINIERIIRLLRDKGYTTGQIARAAEVDIVTVWRWETGKMSPKLDKVNMLLKALND